MIDLDNARYERTRTIGVVLPISIADAIEEQAKSELIAKSSWMRRALLVALNNASQREESPSTGEPEAA
ncbi:hypothetical protein M2175_004579 [Bradyrhizobium elkanii]|uniref:hypothetical protein n=1 Tax=Bradyrhizobium TaxID=374 RepID=UPI002166FF87|nr:MULTISPECIES: hypothetical protein [Bradyrhizobium]MCS3929548.1 hypothetical protein [Bradyrhizobium elkanii]MCS3970104.1 hypothetical protein [Bradyrhizobium japonicum]